MLENATVGGVLSVAGKGVVPNQIGGRVVGTVDVVVVEHDRRVVALKGQVVGAAGAARLLSGDGLSLLLGGGLLLGGDNDDRRLLLGGGLRLRLRLRLDIGRLGGGSLLGSRLRLGSDAHGLLDLSGGLRSRLRGLLKEDNGRGSRLLGRGGIALGDSDGDILIDPLGGEGTLHETLLERSADGAGRGQDGASADKEHRRLHGDRYRSTRRK